MSIFGGLNEFWKMGVTWPGNRPMGELSRLKKLEKIGKNVEIVRALDVKSHTKFQPNIKILTGRIEFLKILSESRDLVTGQWAISAIKKIEKNRQKYANHSYTRREDAHQISAEYLDFNRSNWIF